MLSGASDAPSKKEVVHSCTKASDYDKSKCFFCNEGNSYRNKLSIAASDNAKLNLSKALQLDANHVFYVGLNVACNSSYAQARVGKYHLIYWPKNITDVLGKWKGTEVVLI